MVLNKWPRVIIAPFLLLFHLIAVLWLAVQLETTAVTQQQSNPLFWFQNDEDTEMCFKDPRRYTPHQVRDELLTQPPPTGIVVTLVMGQNTETALCNYLPSQLHYFIFPHHLDILLIVVGNDDTVERLQTKCLAPLLPQLAPIDTRHWLNFDGSNLTTRHYETEHKSTRIILGQVHFLTNPSTTAAKPAGTSTVQQEDSPCRTSDTDYIHATRWYTNELLHLAILQQYEYFVKLDADVVFIHRIPIHLLHDMKVRGAVFAHTAEYPVGLVTPCSNGIRHAMDDFFLASNQTSRRRRICTESNDRLQQDSDRYYTNFIVGRVDYFQSKRVQELGRFLSQYPNGFAKHRWTDQIFFHFALGTYLRDFAEKVVDYTEFRCAPERNCWMSSQEHRRIPGSFDRCDNGGVFLHTRSFRRWQALWDDQKQGEHQLAAAGGDNNLDTPSSSAGLIRSTKPYRTKYKHKCHGSKWEISKK